MGWEVSDVNRTRFAKSIINAAEAVKQIKTAVTKPEELLKLPRIITGSRVYLLVGGQLIGLATNFSWTATSNVFVNSSVDQHIPWEVVPTGMMVRASISQIVDPDESAESQGLWATAQSQPHQPNVEISLYDKLGTNIVNLRGMFNSIQTSVSAAGLMTRTCSFTGYLVTHNVSQGFKPYNDAEFVKKMRNTASDISATTGVL